jgi:RHS repeat-associated protein
VNYPFLTLKERDNETGLDYFNARYFGSTQGRFTSPDPLGGHTEDPQTLNRYTYVRNNPAVLTDPTGLDFYLQCEGKSATCQDGRVGTTDKSGNFTATLISNDKDGRLVDQRGNFYTAKINGQGVSFNGAGSKEYVQGVFLNGTSATTIQGSGDLAGFTFNFTSSNLDANQTAKGTWSYNGSSEQAVQALERAGYNNYLRDTFNIFHPSTDTYSAVDYRSAGDENGRGSGHFTIHIPVTQIRIPGPDDLRVTRGWPARILERGTVPATGEVHFGETNPWVGSAIQHGKEIKGGHIRN